MKKFCVNQEKIFFSSIYRYELFNSVIFLMRKYQKRLYILKIKKINKRNVKKIKHFQLRNNKILNY